jgi:hypothetical protein
LSDLVETIGLAPRIFRPNFSCQTSSDPGSVLINLFGIILELNFQDLTITNHLRITWADPAEPNNKYSDYNQREISDTQPKPRIRLIDKIPILKIADRVFIKGFIEDQDINR